MVDVVSLEQQLGLLVFFLGGFATAVSPCLFPILPLSLLRMFKADSRARALKITIVLLVGVLLTFMVLAILLNILASALSDNFANMSLLFGIILILVGLFVAIPQLRELSAKLPGMQPRLGGGDSPTRYIDVFLLGLTYSFIAIPCAGSIFIALITIMMSKRDIFYAMFGFPFFAIGLAIPYLILALSTAEFRVKIAKWMAARQNTVNILMGVLIILIGIGMIQPFFNQTSWWTWLSGKLDEIFGLDGVVLLAAVFLAVIGLFALYSHFRKKEPQESQKPPVSK